MRFVPLLSSGVLRRGSRAAVILSALAPTVAVGQTVTFKSDWETGLTGSGRFRDLHVPEINQLAQSKTKPRTGKYSAEVIVRPGGELYGGERAEALIMTTPANKEIYETTASGTQFYAFSVRLDAKWQSPRYPLCNPDHGYTWGVLLQLHGPDHYDGASPAFALQAWDSNKPVGSANPVEEFTISLNAGTLDLDNPNDGGKTYRMKSGQRSLVKGAWVDWIFQIKWADENTGFLKAARRDAGKSAFKEALTLNGVATLQRTAEESDEDHYWKTGLYRSSDCTITNRLWIEGPARGTSFDAVRTALWGK